MGLSIEELIKKKKKKEKYYVDKENKNHHSLYGMGGDHKRNNTKSRPVHRYGFKRYSVKQRHRVSKKRLLNTRNKDKFKFESFIKPTDMNGIYKDINGLISLIYNAYSDPNRIIDVYNGNKKDPALKRIISFIGIKYNTDKLSFLYENYLDILHSSILKFIDNIDNYVDPGPAKFYTYFVNIFPYTFTSCFKFTWDIDPNVDNNLDGIVGDLDIDIYSNLLSLYVYTNSMSIKNKRIYFKELLYG